MGNEFVGGLEFERPILELEIKIKELRSKQSEPDQEGAALESTKSPLDREIILLEKEIDRLIKEIYPKLGAWERVQLSRHPSRPHCVDYIEQLIPDFKSLSGDRRFAEDKSVIGGVGHFYGHPVVAIGIEKGRKTKDKIVHNFGMPRPEGYRKALRLMELAERFSLPIITFVDTPGAFPGIEAEERGQANAIAENLEKMFNLTVPLISVIIGEGGSGGALALAVGDRVLMMEYSVYSVISPESCASILWSDPRMADKAANSLQLTPNKALELEVIDGIIIEPPGGAHREAKVAVEKVGAHIKQELEQLLKMKKEELTQTRFKKFRAMGNKTLTGLKN